MRCFGVPPEAPNAIMWVDIADAPAFGVAHVDVEYRGKAAHAAAQPDRGINALDGIITLYNAVNAMRQQLRSDARVHGIITSGGSAANIIPEYAASKWSVRALDRNYQQEVLKRFIACAQGAATATGTTVNVTVHENSSYENMVPSTPISEGSKPRSRPRGPGSAGGRPNTAKKAPR